MRLVLLLLTAALTASAATITLQPSGISCTYSQIVISSNGNIQALCVENCPVMVTGLYREILGREPDPGGLEYWTGACKAGMTEQQMRVEFEPYRPR